MRMYLFKNRFGALVLLLSTLTACGGPLRFAPKGTAKAPEADARIEADVHEDSSITRLEIKIEHLAPPGRLADGGTTFVVWARKDDDSKWQRISALKYDEETRTGELTGVSVPFTTFSLIISVEKESAPEEPSSDVVLSQSVDD